jgi:hypothetical protein
MIETQATEPGLFDLLTRCGRSNPKDGIRVIGARGIQTSEEESRPGCDIWRGESLTLRHQPDVLDKS